LLPWLPTETLLTSLLAALLPTLLPWLPTETLLTSKSLLTSLLAALLPTKALTSLLTAELLSTLLASLLASLLTSLLASLLTSLLASSRWKFWNHVIVNDKLPETVCQLFFAGVTIKVLVNPFHSIFSYLASNHSLNSEFLECFIEEVTQFF
jgi:formate/nitrite transporter FocA (FNT family)